MHGPRQLLVCRMVAGPPDISPLFSLEDCFFCSVSNHDFFQIASFLNTCSEYVDIGGSSLPSRHITLPKIRHYENLYLDLASSVRYFPSFEVPILGNYLHFPCGLHPTQSLVGSFRRGKVFFSTQICFLSIPIPLDPSLMTVLFFTELLSLA